MCEGWRDDASPPLKISSPHMKPAEVLPDLPSWAAWELQLGWMESVRGEELGSGAGRGGGGRSPEIPAAALYFSVHPLRSRQSDP
jgi:hypothetical protein